MTITVEFRNDHIKDINNVKNYDFYPETRMLFIERNDCSFFVPVNENVKAVIVCGGSEHGYLEGHDEAC